MATAGKTLKYLLNPFESLKTHTGYVINPFNRIVNVPFLVAAIVGISVLYVQGPIANSITVNAKHGDRPQ